MSDFTIKFSKKPRELTYEEEISGIMFFHDASREEAKEIKTFQDSDGNIYADCVDENFKPHPLGRIAGEEFFQLPLPTESKPKRKRRHPTKRRRLHH
jgi:hypothetical protein